MGSEEIQSVLNPSNRATSRPPRRNPLTNLQQRKKLDPFYLTREARRKNTQNQNKQKRAVKVKKNRQFVSQLHAPSIAPKRGEDEFAPF